MRKFGTLPNKTFIQTGFNEYAIKGCGGGHAFLKLNLAVSVGVDAGQRVQNKITITVKRRHKLLLPLAEWDKILKKSVFGNLLQISCQKQYKFCKHGK